MQLKFVLIHQNPQKITEKSASNLARKQGESNPNGKTEGEYLRELSENGVGGGIVEALE